MRNTIPENADFRIRSYGKSELAQLYLPNISPCAARRTFNSWIELSPGLSDRLKSHGFSTKSHYYTPMQVRLIVDALGEP